ncbi:glycosyltransferase family 4 protein [Clostridium perfringens]
MNILFLSINFNVNVPGIYSDLMNELKLKGNNIYTVSVTERRNGIKTHLITENGINILKVKTLNIQKVNFFEKGLATILIESQFISAIEKYYKDIKFDLVINVTPPITFEKVIKYIKNRDGANSYLLLKDIFPQNAVDLGILNKKSFLYKFFRRKEENLYKISDYIGCMSPKNVKYLIDNNYYLIKDRVEVCPNSINPTNDINIDNTIRRKLGISEDELMIIYGGNLGKPQGIDFLIDVLKDNKSNSKLKFVIAGDGTEKEKLFKFIESEKLENVIFKERLPKDEYDNLVRVSDLGLILLDKKFTIPNFPSRLLAYMDASIPVLAATDVNTDIGEIIEKNNFGYWCESGDLKKFNLILKKCLDDKKKMKEKGIVGRKYLEENYTSKHSSDIILSHFK